MEKRIFIAVLISLAVLWSWAALAPKLFPDLVKTKPPVAAVQTTTGTSSPTVTNTAPGTAKTVVPAKTPSSVPAAAAVPVTPISAQATRLTTVDTDDYIAVFSNRGAQLISFRLKKYKANPTKKADPTLVELVKQREPSRTDFPFAIETANANVTAANSALFAMDDDANPSADIHGSGELRYRYAANGVLVTKTFRFANEYPFTFTVTVTPTTPYRVMIGPGIRTLGPDERDNQFTVTGNGVVQRDDSLKVINREKADRLNAYPGVQYIGIEDNYFLSALRPAKGADGVLRRIEQGTNKAKRRELFAGLNATSDGTVSGSAFFGPKETGLLDRYGYEKTLQFGMFGVIARFLLGVLQWLNQATHNYGWAIIVLTILIKIVLYPLQHKSIVSMKKMQRVQPKVEVIKQKYKKARTDADQRQKMNTEMMKLYQQEGINPMGGCLPIVLQLPILWGFYGLLSRAIELRGAPFIMWIQDLSAKDPYYITPILMTATMFIQQAITPTTADPMQKRMFMIMPLVFGWIFKEFPSGLVLYWLVQNVLTIVQQLIMNRYWKDHPAELQTA
ncbi:MAG: membrane protein insertase YidC [Thermoanaerobaculia bacterium]